MPHSTSTDNRDSSSGNAADRAASPTESCQSVMVRVVPHLFVDLLPRRLWGPGNLHVLPGGDWHFCVAPGLDDKVSGQLSGEDDRFAVGRRIVELEQRH
jgi:hypothetical protein